MEAIGALSAGIAHDFNNLLTTIIGYTDLMLEQIDSDKPIHEDLSLVRDAGRSAAALTKELLAFGRKQAIRSDHLDVNDIVRQTEQWLRRVLGEGTNMVIHAGADRRRSAETASSWNRCSSTWRSMPVTRWRTAERW